MKHLQWSALVLTALLLVSPLSAVAGEVGGRIEAVNVESQTIELRGDVVLRVTEQSRLFDREGNRIDLRAIARVLKKAPSLENGPMAVDEIPYAFYEAVDARGKLIVEQLRLGSEPY